MGVVNDRNQHLAGALEAEGLLHQQPFAAMVTAFEFDLESLAQDAQGVVVSVQGAVDDRRDHAFWSCVSSICLRTLLWLAG